MLNNFKTKPGINDDDTYKSSCIIVDNEKFMLKKAQQIQCKSDGKNENVGISLKKVDNHRTTFAFKKNSVSENCCFSITRRCRSVSPSPPSTDISTITQTAKLQTLRPENLTRCKKLLRCNGYPNKILLYPEESWARTAASSYWTLSPTWWNYSRCKVVEVTGTKRFAAYGKMIETDSGNLYVIGSFKKCAEPDFRLVLTTNITIADFNLGYCMTGSLERGSHKHNSYQTTHFAVVRRAEFNI